MEGYFVAAIGPMSNFPKECVFMFCDVSYIRRLEKKTFYYLIAL